VVSWLAWGPVPTAVVWLSVVGLQVVRDRYRTWTELYLLGACASIGGYALADLALFNTTSVAVAWLAEGLGVTALILASAFFALFAAALSGRPHRRLLVAFVPAIAMLALVPTLIANVPAFMPNSDVNFEANYAPAGLVVWVAYVDVYGIAGGFLLYRTYREMKAQVHGSTRRVFGFVLAAITGIALWIGVSTAIGVSAAIGVMNLDILPLFATFLAVPGIIAFAATLPQAQSDFSASLRRAKESQYGVQAAFLVYKDGVLIDSMDFAREVGVDTDLFGATLDLVQNFMQTSFPSLGTGGLRSVVQGDRTLVLERGKFTNLIVILSGKEDDLLRRTLRDRLREFEETNAVVLRDWQGRPADAKGTAELLTGLVTMR
jgi:hypothetical protein